MALPQPGDIVGRKYEIVRVLGQGGMAVVYEAIHQRMQLRVALKLIDPQIVSPEVAARFEREARAAASLENEHVAKVLDVDTTDDGIAYMVIELLEGFDLEVELHEKKVIPVPQAVGWILEACIPLAEAHAKGIVHRDLKPSNLFVCKKGDRRILKLLDFGISKMESEADAKLTAQPLGTPHYMSPEQVSGKNVDHRSDIWSLGTVLYELVTGRVPFDAPAMQAIAKIATDPVPPLPSTIPPELARAILRALEKDPAKRFQSVRELATAIAPFGPEDEIIPMSAVERLPAPSSSPIKAAAKARLPLESLEEIALRIDAGTIIQGKYELERRIGRGGMGEVWQAKHVRLGERVAIKILLVGGEDDVVARSRFELEAKVSAKLSRKSRHVVRVLDHGEERDVPFLVMELLDGETLEDRLERGKASFDEIGVIVAHVGRALSVAHTEGVVHRDLKPGNVFLTKDDQGKLLTKVLDFGIARVEPKGNIEDQKHTTAGMVVGTPAYMSPEQIQGFSNGPDCDVWALGALTYEMLTGTPPFIGETQDTVRRMVMGDFVPAGDIRRDAPPAIDDVLSRAFAPKTADRYATAAALADAIDSALHDAVIAPQYDTQDEAPVVVARSRSNMWIPIALLLSTIVIGVGFFAWRSVTTKTDPTTTPPRATTSSVDITPVVRPVDTPSATTTSAPVIATTMRAPATTTKPTTPAPSTSIDRSKIF